MLNFNSNYKQEMTEIPINGVYTLEFFRYWIPYDFNNVSVKIPLKLSYYKKRRKFKMRQNYQVLNISSTVDFLHRTAYSVHDGYKVYREIEPYYILRKFLKILITFKNYFIDYIKYYNNLVDNFYISRSFTVRTRFNFSFFRVHHYFFCCTTYIKLVRRFNLYFFHRKFFIMRFVLKTLSFFNIYQKYFKRKVFLSFSLNDLRSYKQKRYTILNDLNIYMIRNFFIYNLNNRTFFALGFFKIYFYFSHSYFLLQKRNLFYILRKVPSKLLLFSFLGLKYCFFFLMKQRLFFTISFLYNVKKINIKYLYFEYKVLFFFFNIIYFNFYLVNDFFSGIFVKLLSYYNYIIFLISTQNDFFFKKRHLRYFFMQYVSLFNSYFVSTLYTYLIINYNLNFSLYFLSFSSVPFFLHSIKLEKRFYLYFEKVLHWHSKARFKKKLIKVFKRYYVSYFLRKFCKKKLSKLKLFLLTDYFFVKKIKIKTIILNKINSFSLFQKLYKSFFFIHKKNERKFLKNFKFFLYKMIKWMSHSIISKLLNFNLFYFSFKILKKTLKSNFYRFKKLGLFFVFIFGKFFKRQNEKGFLTFNRYFFKLRKGFVLLNTKIFKLLFLFMKFYNRLLVFFNFKYIKKNRKLFYYLKNKFKFYLFFKRNIKSLFVYKNYFNFYKLKVNNIFLNYYQFYFRRFFIFNFFLKYINNKTIKAKRKLYKYIYRFFFMNYYDKLKYKSVNKFFIIFVNFISVIRFLLSLDYLWFKKIKKIKNKGKIKGPVYIKYKSLFYKCSRLILYNYLYKYKWFLLFKFSKKDRVYNFHGVNSYIALRKFLKSKVFINKNRSNYKKFLIFKVIKKI